MSLNFPLNLRKQNGETIFQLNQFCECTSKNYTSPSSQEGEYFLLFWIKQGKGKCVIDGKDFSFTDNTFFSFIPNQTFTIYPEGEVKGSSIYFHSDFYCMSSHVRELSGNGIMFNKLYSSSVLNLSGEVVSDFTYFENKIIEEICRPESLAKSNVLIAYLKLFLITIARIRLEQMQKSAKD